MPPRSELSPIVFGAENAPIGIDWGDYRTLTSPRGWHYSPEMYYKLTALAAASGIADVRKLPLLGRRQYEYNYREYMAEVRSGLLEYVIGKVQSESRRSGRNSFRQLEVGSQHGQYAVWLATALAHAEDPITMQTDGVDIAPTHERRHKRLDYEIYTSSVTDHHIVPSSLRRAQGYPEELDRYNPVAMDAHLLGTNVARDFGINGNYDFVSLNGMDHVLFDFFGVLHKCWEQLKVGGTMFISNKHLSEDNFPLVEGDPSNLNVYFRKASVANRRRYDPKSSLSNTVGSWERNQEKSRRMRECAHRLETLLKSDDSRLTLQEAKSLYDEIYENMPEDMSARQYLAPYLRMLAEKGTIKYDLAVTEVRNKYSSDVRYGASVHTLTKMSDSNPFDLPFAGMRLNRGYFLQITRALPNEVYRELLTRSR